MQLRHVSEDSAVVDRSKHWYDLRDTPAKALASTGWWFVRASGRIWSINAGCVAAACAAMMLSTATTTADQSAVAPAPLLAPANPTAAATTADHQNMMQQLGITALRPGPSGNESAPNHANYDEAFANPYPRLPQVLTLKTGRDVTSAAAWWSERRPEIVEEFDREVVGRVPNNVPKVTWVVNRTDHFSVGGRPGRRQGAPRKGRQLFLPRRHPWTFR
jgi:hypothetical protein